MVHNAYATWLKEHTVVGLNREAGSDDLTLREERTKLQCSDLEHSA
jgi:hypothetical protein